jgi:hypothetical protein
MSTDKWKIQRSKLGMETFRNGQNLASARPTTQWLARAIQPGGYNGLRSIASGGLAADCWRQLTARAAVWQAWQRTDQNHVRNNNVLLIVGITNRPDNPRNIG